MEHVTITDGVDMFACADEDGIAQIRERVRPKGSETLFYQSLAMCKCGQAPFLEVIRTPDKKTVVNVGCKDACERCHQRVLEMGKSINSGCGYHETINADMARAFQELDARVKGKALD